MACNGPAGRCQSHTRAVLSAQPVRTAGQLVLVVQSREEVFAHRPGVALAQAVV
jgi:hypothetical protein